MPVRQCQGETVEATMVLPQECVSERIAEQVADGSVPKEIVNAVQFVPQERVDRTT